MSYKRLSRQKIAIIGSGISALSLAYFLEKKSKQPLSITLFEKSDTIGGRVVTKKTEKASYELGPRGFRPSGKGKKTLLLAKELGLEPIFSSPFAKKRFLADETKLQPLNLWYLCKKKLLFSLLTEWRKKQNPSADESVCDFFSRRISKKFAQEIISPLCHGIFAQDANTLSIEACFPKLWEHEKKSHSLTSSFLHKKKENTPALCTFKEGMQALPHALLKKISSPVLFHHEVKKISSHKNEFLLHFDNQIIATDFVIHSSPSEFLEKRVSITLVHLLTKQKLSHKGFGFLTTKKSSLPLFGATFDSETFSEISSDYTKICFFLEGDLSEKMALSIAEEAAICYLQLKTPFEEFFVTWAKNAIYCYPLHHKKILSDYEKTLPKKSYILGELYGIGVNECIDRADLLSDQILQEI